MLDLAVGEIERMKQSGRSVTFVCHRLNGSTPIERMTNIFSLSDLLVNLTVFSNTYGFNQLWFHADFNPDDPREFSIKFDVFYNGLLAACDQVIVAPGYEGALGCETEIAHAKKIGKPIYMLKKLPPPRDQDWLHNYAGELAVELAVKVGWGRIAHDSLLNVPVENLIPWQRWVESLDS